MEPNTNRRPHDWSSKFFKIWKHQQPDPRDENISKRNPVKTKTRSSSFRIILWRRWEKVVAESGNTLGIQLSQIRHRNIVRPAWGLTINGTENYSKRLHKPIFLSILWSLICGRLCGLIFSRLPLHSAIVRSVHKTHVFRTVCMLKNLAWMLTIGWYQGAFSISTLL